MNNDNETCVTNPVIRKGALEEVGNIGAAHAATSLSKMVGEEIFVSVTDSHILRVEELPEFFGKMDDIVVAVFMDINNTVNGAIMLIFPKKNAIMLGNTVLGEDDDQSAVTNDTLVTENIELAMAEIGNIIGCSYLNVISKMVDTVLIPSPPGVAVDMLGAILQVPASMIGLESELATVIETSFVRKRDTFSGFVLFMPDKKIQESLIEQFC